MGPADGRPAHLWELIADAVWPGYREARQRAATEVADRSSFRAAMQPLWDLQHLEEQLRLVIVTENSD